MLIEVNSFMISFGDILKYKRYKLSLHRPSGMITDGIAGQVSLLSVSTSSDLLAIHKTRENLHKNVKIGKTLSFCSLPGYGSQIRAA
jgi:hypothetical protein